jgi:hypothetical protein
MKPLALISKFVSYLIFVNIILCLNRLIGQGTVLLNDVIRTGTIKRRIVQLTNPQGVLLEAVSLKI